MELYGLRNMSYESPADYSYIERMLDMPNLYNSFSNTLNDTENNITIKSLYSNEELSTRYNYIFNKLL
jgi:hypothetical protein